MMGERYREQKALTETKGLTLRKRKRGTGAAEVVPSSKKTKRSAINFWKMNADLWIFNQII